MKQSLIKDGIVVGQLCLHTRSGRVALITKVFDGWGGVRLILLKSWKPKGCTVYLREIVVPGDEVESIENYEDCNCFRY